MCSEALSLRERCYKCTGNHNFDVAKEGYVNLLTGNHKDGSLIGDNKEMARSRKNVMPHPPFLQFFCGRRFDTG